MPKTPLRVVQPDEKPPAPMTLLEATESGDYFQILLAQRREIVSDLPDEKGPAKAALHRQLSLISKEIEAIQARDRREGSGSASEVSDGEFDAAAI